MRIAFIGGGSMGEAMVNGILSIKLAAPDAVVVSDISQARREVINKTHGVEVTDDSREAAEGADVVVLAVKPQQLKGVVEGLQGALGPQQLILSIVAGASLDEIARGMKHDFLVRAMPNMPARVGRGVTVWTATAQTSEAQRRHARDILSALGREIYVEEEKYLDMATAVSGSGPAYVFLVIEALTDAAVHIGLPRNMAEELVVETVLGSAYAVQSTGQHPAELRNMVTSPGGTTAEGLLELEKGGFRALLARAVLSAYEKAVRLGK